MSNNETFNGWKNRETWVAWTYISNTKHVYDGVRKYRLNGQGIRNLFDDVQIGVNSGFNQQEASRQMIKEIGNLDRVDWNAIAEALKD